jgi:hypothetical protein
VKVQVKDDEGETGVDTAVVDVSSNSQNPIADASGPYSSQVNEAIAFDCSESYDPDGGIIVEYRWDWENDDIWDTDWIPFSNGITEHTYNEEFHGLVKVQVKDDEGETGVDTAAITIHDEEKIIDQEQPKYSGSGWGVWGPTAKQAQSFVPTMEILKSIELRIWKKTILGILYPKGLKISITNSLDAESLTSIYIPSNKISVNGQWIEFDFPDIYVDPGKVYYIIFEPDGAKDQYHTFYWGYDINNPYQRGNSWISMDLDWEIHEPKSGFDFCFRTYGAGNRMPNKPDMPNGQINGRIKNEYEYKTIGDDPDNDQIYYFWDWGDGTNSGWLGPVPSGTTLRTKHIFLSEGDYQIRIKIKDDGDLESEWSDSLIVSMPKNKFSPTFLQHNDFFDKCIFFLQSLKNKYLKFGGE